MDAQGGLLGSPGQAQELDSTILMGPPQLRIFCESTDYLPVRAQCWDQAPCGKPFLSRKPGFLIFPTSTSSFPAATTAPPVQQDEVCHVLPVPAWTGTPVTVSLGFWMLSQYKYLFAICKFKQSAQEPVLCSMLLPLLQPWRKSPSSCTPGHSHMGAKLDVLRWGWQHTSSG